MPIWLQPGHFHCTTQGFQRSKNNIQTKHLSREFTYNAMLSMNLSLVRLYGLSLDTKIVSISLSVKICQI